MATPGTSKHKHTNTPNVGPEDYKNTFLLINIYSKASCALVLQQRITHNEALSESLRVSEFWTKSGCALSSTSDDIDLNIHKEVVAGKANIIRRSSAGKLFSLNLLFTLRGIIPREWERESERERERDRVCESVSMITKVDRQWYLRNHWPHLNFSQSFVVYHNSRENGDESPQVFASGVYGTLLVKEIPFPDKSTTDDTRS